MSYFARNIAIIGGGQGGLQLALHLLLHQNYKVTLYTDRSAQDVYDGHILSSQGMFDLALQNERKLGLNFWDDVCPKNESFSFAVADNQTHQKAISWQTSVKPYQSIDQRMKFSAWLSLFVERGGTHFIEAVTLDRLNQIAINHDLTVVATGKGTLSKLFQRDTALSSFSTPQRALSCLYVHEMQPANNASGVRGNIIPGIGEYFTVPGLTKTGCCEMMLFEGIIDGPFDCWQSLTSPEEYVAQAKRLLSHYVPWEAERCQSIRSTDDKAVYSGCFTPEIRHTAAKLSCGKYVLGLGDAVILNDPIAGQGANHACKSAYLYATSIIDHQDKPFDETWIRNTAALSWNKFGRYSTQLSNLLLAPPTVQLMAMCEKAVHDPAVASALAQGFNDPASLAWLYAPEAENKITT